MPAIAPDTAGYAAHCDPQVTRQPELADGGNQRNDQGGPFMSSTAITMPTPPLFDEARLAVAGFLARYSGPTRKSYVSDLRQFFAWCASVDLEIFATKRGHIELWARSMEEKGLARATIGRRLSTVAGFYRICVLDGLIEHSPAEYVRRPKIDTESATLGLDRMELSAFIAQGAAPRADGPRPGVSPRAARPAGV